MNKKLKPIITTPDARLRQKSTKVGRPDETTQAIVDDMVTACLEWEKSHPFEVSAALAAPQIGVNKRIIIIRDDTEDKSSAAFTALIDPEVIKTDGKTVKDYEGCLSVPFLYGLVPRPEKARIKAKLLTGQEVRIKADGILARTLLHEIDHLDGILFIDHIKDNEDAFFELDDKGELQPIDYNTRVKGNKELFPDED